MTDSIRSRTWVWNPFITESTMISAITPSAIDTTDVAEMKETNRVLPSGSPAGTRIAEADQKFKRQRHGAQILKC